MRDSAVNMHLRRVHDGVEISFVHDDGEESFAVIDVSHIPAVCDALEYLAALPPPPPEETKQ